MSNAQKIAIKHAAGDVLDIAVVLSIGYLLVQLLDVVA